MRATKKQTNKSIAGKMFFYLLFVSQWVFSSPEVSCFFRKSATIYNSHAGQKKTHVFFGNARPKSDARAHLKQRKKHSGLTEK